jgi:hypothetical protein
MNNSLYEKVMKEGIEDIKSGVRSSVESTQNSQPHPYPEKWENKYPTSSLQLSDKQSSAVITPWPEETIQEAMKSILKSSTEFKSHFAAFACGVRCREEGMGLVKPFPAPGAWFPVDIFGNPMIEVKPGHWDIAQRVSSSLILRITTAYEQGVGQANRTELKNPYPAGSPEREAWTLGREHGKENKKQNNSTPL